MSWSYEATKADAIIVRIEEENDESLGAMLTNAKRAARGYHDSLALVERKTAILDKKMQQVAEQDCVLDQAVEDTAKAFIGAGFTKRSRPFAAFTSYSPSRLCGLKMAREVQEVQSLITKVEQANPPEALSQTIAKLLQQATLMDTKLQGLTQPQNDLRKAEEDRAEAALELKRAMRKLRLGAELAWPNDPEKLERLFASPEEVQDSVRRKRKGGEAASTDAKTDANAETKIDAKS
jgi:hypothetical protein